MKVFYGTHEIDASLRGAVLTVGNFDGVHLGHQRILRTAHALARVSSASVVAMTFEPHPLVLLRPTKAPARLTPWPEKVQALARAGADAVVRLGATRELLALPAEAFVREILVKRIHPAYIVEGPNFGFGRGREGDVDTLRALSPKGGFQVHVVEPYRLVREGDEHVVVSSTVIREALERGEVEFAAACLGRPYALVGKVIRGAGAGKGLGYPTINLDVGEQLVPAEGVYAGRAEVGPRRGKAAISIGRRPTLGGDRLSIEAFVLDSAGDWYGAEARIEVMHRLRGQIKFEGKDALVAQIARDVEQTRALVEV